MTIEDAIKELKEDIDLYIPLHGTIDDVDRELPDGRLITALEKAIASLEALEKIRQEIKELASADTVDVLVDVMRIINRHLGEVTT